LSEARRTCTIVNQRGLHARASAKFVGAVAALTELVEAKFGED
jgi:phosphocarrier protein